MKKLILGLALMCTTFASTAFAATGSVTANVNVVYVDVSSSAYTLVDLKDYTGSYGNCKQPPAAAKLFLMPYGAQGDKMRQFFTTALIEGNKVRVYWDDTKTASYNGTSGYCIIQKVGLITN